MKPIFAVDYGTVVADVPFFDHIDGDIAPNNWAMPFVRRKSEAADLWAGDPQVQKALTTFGGEYKKGVSGDRAQFPFEDTDSIQRMNTMVDSENMRPPMVADIKDVSGGMSFQDSSWMFGYTPQMKWVGLAPNCAAIQRWLALGGLHIVAVDIRSLVKHMAKKNKVAEEEFIPKIEDTQAFLEELDAAGVSAAAKDGVIMRQVTLEKKCSAFIPMGWMCIERALPSHPLIYGARKSFMTADTGSLDRYELLTKMFTSSGKSVSRMEQILELIRARCVT